MNTPTPVTLEELKDLIEDNIAATEENTKILKTIRRDALIGGIIKFVFWVAIIALSFYLSAKFLEPYMGMLQGGESQHADYQALFEQYQELLGQ